MQTLAPPLDCFDMGKQSAAVKRGINFRLEVALLDELDRYIKQQVPATTPSAVMAAALREWLDKHAPPARKPPAR